jgi:N-acetylglutamate synthase-like GNAT family acetyltransferase
VAGSGPVAAGDSLAPVIRRATGQDAAALTALALRSKAVWGYDAAFMAACREELTISAAAIAERPTSVLEEKGRIVGFCQLRIDAPAAEVAQFFIAPGSLRGGRGRRLWAHLEAFARAAGCTRLEADADPHAEGFYRAMGMIRAGEAASGSIPGRLLPHLRKEL